MEAAAAIEPQRQPHIHLQLELPLLPRLGLEFEAKTGDPLPIFRTWSIEKRELESLWTSLYTLPRLRFRHRFLLGCHFSAMANPINFLLSYGS